jgi:hypothetical protein
MKTSISFREVGLILSLCLLVLCPVIIVFFSDYIDSLYPNEFNVGVLFWVDLVTAISTVFCVRGWKWRVVLVILGLVSLVICFEAALGAGGM